MNLIQRAFRANPQIVRDLRKVQAKIRQFPKSYRQSTWGTIVDNSPEHPCGTAACIAGQYALVAGRVLSKLGSGATNWCKPGEDTLLVSADSVLRTDILAALGLSWDPDSFLHSQHPDLQTIYLALESLFTASPIEGWPDPFSTDWASVAKILPPHNASHYVISLICDAKDVMFAEIACQRLDYFIEKGI